MLALITNSESCWIHNSVICLYLKIKIMNKSQASKYTDWIHSLNSCTLFKVQLLPIVPLPKGLLLLAAKKTCWYSKTLKCALQWSKVLPVFIGGKELMLATESLGTEWFLLVLQWRIIGLRPMRMKAIMHFTTCFAAAQEIRKAACWQVLREPQAWVCKKNDNSLMGLGKKRWPAEQKLEMPTDIELMEETGENFNENIMELQH